MLFLLVFSYGFLPIYFLPIPSSFLIVISFLVLLFYSLVKSRKSLANMDSFIVFLIFLAWYAIHIFFSGQLQYSLIDFRLMFVLNISVFFFSLYYSHLRNYVAQILFSAGLVYVFFSVWTFYLLSSSPESFAGFTNIFAASGLDTSGDAVYQNYGLWLSILMITSAYFIYHSINNKSKIKLFLFSIAFIFSIIGILVIGARAAFIGGVFGLIYFLSRVKIRNLIMPLIGAFCILLPLFLINEELLLTINRITRLFYGTDDSGRLFMFSQAFNLWSQDWVNVIFGAGIKSYPIFIGVNSAGAYPHNIFLEILCELGVIGLSLFLLIFYNAFKYKSNDPLMTSLTVCMIFIYSFTGGMSDIYNIFFFLGLSIKK